MSNPDPPPPADRLTGAYHPSAGDASTAPGPAAAPAEPDSPPPDAGRYQPVKFHRKGGMGRLYVARDTELNRDVALKDIQPQHAADPAAVRLFLFEAEVTGGLEHPGVVPVYGLGRSADGRPFYAMRFVHGESLRDAIRAHHAADPHDPLRAVERAVALRRLLARFLAVCQTIAYAHSRGVIHRDLKPDNVMLGPFGETLVVDWGLAKRVRSGETAEIDPTGGPGGPDAITCTLPGAKLGTAAYWAPEQAKGETDKHDERTDVYGLGGILFEVLTNKPPNRAGGPRAVIDDDLDLIVRKALATDPAARHQSAGELAAVVERWLADQPVAGQRAVVAALRRQAGDHPGDRMLAEQLARQLANLGLVLSGMDRHPDAIIAFADATRLFKELSEETRGQPRLRAELANCHLYAAHSFTALGRADESAAQGAIARDIFDGLIAAHPDEYWANYASFVLPQAVPAAATAAPQKGAADTHDLAPAAADEHRTVHPPGPTDGPPPESDDLGGPFTVLAEIGRGGMGRTLLARDNDLGRLVAIKESLGPLTAYARRRAVLEYKITARLEHPNVLPVYGLGRHGGSGRPFLIVRHVTGVTLRMAADVFHAADGPMGVDNPQFARLVGAVAQAADALEFAHGRGILHRDPKPANILLTRGGEAYLIDWGLAKVFRPELSEIDLGDDGPDDRSTIPPLANPELTQAGAVLGTPAYMPAEMARGESADERTDVAVLGGSLFQVLTGRPPRAGASVPEVVRAAAADPPPRPRDVRADVPAALDAICGRAMAFDPADRYPDPGQLAADLRAWLAGS